MKWVIGTLLTSLSFALKVSDHACANRNYWSCLTYDDGASSSKALCGGWCLETRQCVENYVDDCPLNESKAHKRLSVASAGLAQCLVATNGKHKFQSRGLCVPKNTDGTYIWDDATCVDVTIPCHEELLAESSLDLITCDLRKSCFDCYTGKFGSKITAAKAATGTPASYDITSTFGPDCVWTEEGKCIARPEGDERTHGSCPNENTYQMPKL